MESKPRYARPKTASKLIPYALSGMAGFAVLALFVGGFASSNVEITLTAIRSVIDKLGYDDVRAEGKSIVSLLLEAPVNYLRDVDIPQVVIDIKFKHWQRILTKREIALAAGVLTQEDGDFVPATMHYTDGHLDRAGQRWKAQVRRTRTVRDGGFLTRSLLPSDLTFGGPTPRIPEN